MRLNKTGILCGLTAIPLAMLPGTAHAREAGLYRVEDPRATVRMNPGGFVIGNLVEPETFYVLEESGHWAYGRANGNADKCGWVLKAHLRRTPMRGNHPRPSCPASFSGVGKQSRDYLLAHHASEVNDVGPGSKRVKHGCGIRLTSARALWGNVKGNATAGPKLADLAPNTLVQWRYRAKANRGVILVGANGTWGFVRVDPNAPLPHTRANGHCPPGAPHVGL